MEVRLIPAVALASLVPGAAATPAPAEHRDSNVLITRSGPDPSALSGIIAFAVGFSGIAAGREQTYFIPFMRFGQPKPRVGERCDVRWRWWNGFQWGLGDGSRLSSGRLVSRFHCRRGSRSAA